MGNKDYSEREAAETKLRGGIAHYAAALEAALDDPPSVEAKMRIQSLLRADRDAAKELVIALRLLDDVEYLKVIQYRCADDAKPLVAARLETLQAE